MTEGPKEANDGIHVSTGEHKKKAFGLFGGSESGKLILIPDKVQRQVIVEIILLNGVSAVLDSFFPKFFLTPFFITYFAVDS